MGDSMTKGLVKSEAKADGVVYTERGVVLTNLDEAWKFASLIAKSTDMCPKSFRGKPEAVLAAMQTGAELGLNPMQSLSSIHIIEGTPTLSGATLLALMNRPGVAKKGKRTEIGSRVAADDKLEGYCWSWRAGDDDPIESVFTQDEAVAMGLWDRKSRDGKPTPWVTMKGVMLSWRAAAKHSRRFYSDVVKGLYMTEEIAATREAPRGVAHARDVTPPEGTVTGRADPLLSDPVADPAEPETPEGDVGETAFVDEDGREVDPDTGEVIPTEEELEAERR